MHDKWNWVPWLALSLAVVGLDQWTKGLAGAQLEYGQPVVILPVLNFTLQYNTGAAFSFLSEQSGWQRWFFSAVAALVSVVLLLWLSGVSKSIRPSLGGGASAVERRAARSCRTSSCKP